MKSRRAVLKKDGRGEAGNVAVITALCLTVLLSVMAFVLETGALYVTRNEYQNAVEAAAMAGAFELCGEDPVRAARDIAVANGCPDTDALTVQLGFYDELGEYGDFSVYRDFEADPNPDTPSINEGVLKNSDGDYHINNAVLVTVNESRSSLTGILTDEEVHNVAAASAYLVRYGIIAGEEGMIISSSFRSDYPRLKDTSVHANGDIIFNGTESASGDVRITATGNITGCPLEFEEHTDEVKIQPLDDVMEELRDLAERRGTLIDTSAWPVDSENWYTAAFGRYQKTSETTSNFSLSDGDHEGAIYFLASTTEGSPPPGLQNLYLKRDAVNTEHEAWNFILATDVPQLLFQQWSSNPPTPIILGGTGDEMAEIYASGTITFHGRYSQVSRRYYRCNGVLFRAQEFFSSWYRRPSWDTDTNPQKMRILAEKISFQGDLNATNPTIDALFGPPCPPCIVRLGALESAGD